MKDIVSVDGSRSEVEVQRLSPFRMLTREEAAAAPAALSPPVSPSPRQSMPPPPTPAAEPVPAFRSVTAPLPGTILDIRVAVGQAVKAGQIAVTMEAMKMEHEIPSSEDGTVAQILVGKGDSVETGAVLIQLL